MKLGQKIFVISYLLIMISMYILGYLMVNNNYQTSMEKEMTLNISSHNVLRKILLEYLETKESKNTDLALSDSTTSISIEADIEERNKTIGELVEDFNKNASNNQYVQVCRNASIIFSNILNIPEVLKHSDTSKITTYITKIEEDRTMFVISSININEIEYEIVTGKSIASIYQNREEEIAFFTKISIFLSIVVSILLFLFTSIISHRIKKLSNVVSKVADGNYDMTLKVKGKDEISALSSNVNKMTKAINQNLERVNKLSEARKEFIADITHEIRTPLTSIIGYSDLLKKVKISDEKKMIEYADRIYKEGQYIKELSEKLMDITLLENNQIELQLINLSQVAQEACLSIEGCLEEHIKLIKEIAPNIYIKADQALIKSVIINLIRNSIFACENKDAMIFLHLDHEKLEVIDNGKGISKKEIHKILEPFYTLDQSRNRERAGLGLGLYLCKKIIDLHHFTLKIDSVQKEGTKVSIYFKEDDK